MTQAQLATLIGSPHDHFLGVLYEKEASVVDGDCLLDLEPALVFDHRLLLIAEDDVFELHMRIFG